MVLNNELILGILGSFVAIFGTVFAYIQSKNEKRLRQRSESQKQIGVLRNELDRIRDEKYEANDALTRQMARCMYSGNDKEKLKPLIEEAEQAVKEYAVKEKELYAKMNYIWESSV